MTSLLLLLSFMHKGNVLTNHIISYSRKMPISLKCLTPNHFLWSLGQPNKALLVSINLHYAFYTQKIFMDISFFCSLFASFIFIIFPLTSFGYHAPSIPIIKCPSNNWHYLIIVRIHILVNKHDSNMWPHDPIHLLLPSPFIHFFSSSFNY